MIKQLHPKSTPSNSASCKKTNAQITVKQMLRDISADLLQPREQAVANILAKAAQMKLV